MPQTKEQSRHDRTDIRYVRRIVTGVDGEGRSLIVSDGPALNLALPDHSPIVGHVVWATGEDIAPGDNPVPEDHVFAFHSNNGTILRIVDFPPDETYDVEKVATFLDENDVRDKDNPRHFWFHVTPTLDYAIVLEGEIYAMLDKNETLMREGDVLIQRATNHSWSNRSGHNCRMAFVLIHGDTSGNLPAAPGHD